ncbi:hypothetical protein SO802_030815 [Lithocarpus litseifolius]|uniref:Uncharacterized protein n=1 Tax=Lithocarpus litseifolius TaxID=425828 RepID=A0AAW2BM24_9ROSI
MKMQEELEGRLGDGEEDGYDAVVVGSGYGGSVAACRMSIAGIKACLIEKGRKWEAQDFPTDSLKIMSTTRMESLDLGIRFGPKDALFQVYEQNDSLVAVACGLGGGSLVNAGVMLPTPVHARRNPKWPKEWERDWDDCEASAVAMLRTQSVPVKFPAAKVLGEIADGQIEIFLETSVKLSMNFDLEESMANSMMPQKMDSRLARGNCLAGCPYNAKKDGFIISCRQWKCTQNSSKLEGPKQPYPVLLLNGYSTESYWLPTEPNDLVRTLLEEGHEVWLLQPRLHPLNPSNNFTTEDIGGFDVPAATYRILELHGKHVKIHVVAHCVGGLAIHVALMGGHLSATHIASLSCTNSLMFFKLNPLSMFKMWLPLVPARTQSLVRPLLETSKSSLPHRLLKSITRLIPRYERCTCNECEVFSGIFGNTFCHENLSPSMHYWLNKENVTKLSMAAFPHLRKICNAGNIVDSEGNNSYLIHPERMPLTTLYISGGRSLLVTPKTPFLANKYMKLHQPGFRHERFVVEGFGHSDLLIGDESYKKVFPHTASHIRSAERENGAISVGGRKYSKEAMDWEDDPYEEYGGFITWFSPYVVIFLFLMLVALCLSMFNVL